MLEWLNKQASHHLGTAQQQISDNKGTFGNGVFCAV
jgi:hypothetical protein